MEQLIIYAKELGGLKGIYRGVYGNSDDINGDSGNPSESVRELCKPHFETRAVSVKAQLYDG